ncbi:MAG: hypothetical protein HZB23_14550 [Deltaproteobacteria bacterium]|nr:hypothetical protein [Deltaproteobacteria bacterium]
MGSNSEKSGLKGTRYGSLVWVLLSLVLIILPLAAVAKLMLVSDEELDDVVGQSLLEFSIVNRTVATPGGNMVFTPAILKVNALVIINNVHMTNVRLGWWGSNFDNPAHDMQIYGAATHNGSTAGGTATGLTWGGAGYPIYMRGLRIELAYDNLYAANPNFLFLRVGSDDFSGCLDADPDGNGLGSLERLSFDGRVQSSGSIWPIPAIGIDEQFNNDTATTGPLGIEIPFSHVTRMYFHVPAVQDEGRTDWFISLANNISMGGNNNSVSWNPKTTVAENVPARGYWMHFQSLYAAANTGGLW